MYPKQQPGRIDNCNACEGNVAFTLLRRFGIHIWPDLHICQLYIQAYPTKVDVTQTKSLDPSPKVKVNANIPSAENPYTATVVSLQDKICHGLSIF